MWAYVDKWLRAYPRLTNCFRNIAAKAIAVEGVVWYIGGVRAVMRAIGRLLAMRGKIL